MGVLQQKQLRWLSNRTLALPLGQAIFTYQTIKPSQAEKFDIRELNLSARIPPTNSIVELDTAQILPMKNWSEFHSGVASGLSVFDDTNFVDSSWISFNQTLSQESTVVFDNKHAGFLLGLGLNGHLKSLQAFDFYDYLIAKDDITSIGLSLGLAASYTRTMDPQITKLLSIHVQGMLPPGSALLNISALTQTVSVLGLGLVYMGTLNRKMAECMLKELLRDFKSQKDSTFESCSHAYTVAAGFSLVSND